jgi:hypothetical protein
MVAGILMMGLTQAYFEFAIAVPCGIPSFTLLGERRDWEQLAAKLERLSEFGDEPAQYGTQLRPIFKRFVKTFDNPQDPEIRKFWANIVRAGFDPYSGRTGPVEGWLNGFQFWNSFGKLAMEAKLQPGQFVLTLDSITYPQRLATAFPPGYAKVPITLETETGPQEAQLLAGLVGKMIKSGAPAGYADSIARVNFQLPTNITDAYHASLHPQAGWFLYRKVQGANFSVPSSEGAEYMPIWLKNGLKVGTCPRIGTNFL